MRTIKRAIISLSDKTGLAELVEVLTKYEIEIFSTGGTLKALSELGAKVQSIEGYTGFREMLDGRVKTLHPKIHGGILARRDDAAHMKAIAEAEILPFDLVCVNLYPFERVATDLQNKNVGPTELAHLVENIDIGGPSLIRAAAKNYESVTVLTAAGDYAAFITEINQNAGATSPAYRFQQMLKALSRTSAYDGFIANYLQEATKTSIGEHHLHLREASGLRYGENAHQAAKFYVRSNRSIGWQCLHGKELSYNNILDINAGLRLVSDFAEPVVAIFKHTNPCGVAVGEQQLEALAQAEQSDPVSYFGGIAFFNRKVEPLSGTKLHQSFYEIIVAPDYAPEAMAVLQQKKNLRIVRCEKMNEALEGQTIASAAGGYLMQAVDSRSLASADLKVMTKANPTPKDIEELIFADKIVKHLKSNAVAFTRDKQTLALGTGQMSRIDATYAAVEKARRAGHDLKGSYFASDAFFPFKDSVELAIAVGAKAIIAPGGSLRDQESIDCANDKGVAMIFTGVRRFRH